MSKFLLTLVFIAASILSAHANNCDIKINKVIDDPSIQKMLEKGLAKKGYIASTSAEAEYALNIYYGHATTLTDCYIYSAYLRVENSGKQTIAESLAEASFLREILNRYSIPKAVTRKSLRKLLRVLPTCE